MQGPAEGRRKCSGHVGGPLGRRRYKQDVILAAGKGIFHAGAKPETSINLELGTKWNLFNDKLLATEVNLSFVQISAIFTGVADLKKIFEAARLRRQNGKGTLLFVDEAQMSAFNKAKVMEANLKNYIVEPYISVRHMYQQSTEVRNYLNLIFASNKDDPVLLDPSDRRFNVGAYQDEKLVITTEEVDELEDLAWPFFVYLMGYPAIRDVARIPLDNEARQKLVHINRSTIDTVSDALAEGDISFFQEHVFSGPIEGLPAYLGRLKGV